MRYYRWCCLLVLLGLGLPGAEEPRPVFVSTSAMDWQPVESPVMPPGAFRRAVYRDLSSSTSVSQLKYPKGYIEPPHRHAKSGLFVFVVKGCLRSGETVARSGTFIFYAPGSTHAAIEAVEESELLVWANGPVETTLLPDRPH